jgi:hypothetical protein
MSIYKIFPEQTATIYSYYPALNTGIDEILELSTFYSANGTNEVSRILLKFPTDDINSVFNNNVKSSSFDCYLKLYLANASEIPLTYTIYGHPLATDWNHGTGRLANSPSTTDGVSWMYVDQASGSNWFISNIYPVNTTGSYRSGSYAGGGLWYSGSSYITSQSFTYKATKDIELNVSNIVKAFNSGSITNNGIILKHSSILEFTSASKFETKYFSDNTHTIYPPTLEIRWDDSKYITGSQSVIDSDLYTVGFGNNKERFNQDSVQRFRIKVRPKYPPRTYSDSSFSYNLVNYALPSSSYWTIRDLDAEEIIIDYDTNYTKLSCDANGNYFDVYMNGLQPERYYQILIKSILPNGETVVVFDSDYNFKVIK